MSMENNGFTSGLRCGVPIAAGYLAVSFAYGISAILMGLSPLEALMISLFNLTSAGQLAGTPIIASGGSLVELVTSHHVNNQHYNHLLSVYRLYLVYLFLFYILKTYFFFYYFF